MNKKILDFFTDMYDRETKERESILMPASNNLILIEFSPHKESRLMVGYKSIDGYSKSQVESIAKEIIVTLLQPNIQECNASKDGKILGRTNGDFVFKGKQIHYIVLAIRKASQGIDINISFSIK